MERDFLFSWPWRTKGKVCTKFTHDACHDINLDAACLKANFDIRKSELPFALLMFSYFFLIITSFWILKPIKKSLFIELVKVIENY